MKVCIYSRVSTSEQTTENQLIALREATQRHGWTIAAEYTDESISGAKGKTERPGLAALELAAGRREFDKVCVFALDRLGRNTAQLVVLVDELAAKGIGLYVHQLGMDTATPAGKLVLTVMAGLAEMERSLIVERVKAGVARAQAEGKHCGRPPLKSAVVKRVQALRAKGQSIRAIAQVTGVSKSAVARAVAA